MPFSALCVHQTFNWAYCNNGFNRTSLRSWSRSKCTYRHCYYNTTSNYNTALYLIAEYVQGFVAMNISIAKILIKYGARLDQEHRVTWKTARQLFKEKEEIYQNENGDSCCFYPLNNKILPLSCQCANVIVQHRIPFDVRLPTRLHGYIRQHDLLISNSTPCAIDDFLFFKIIHIPHTLSFSKFPIHLILVLVSVCGLCSCSV